MKTRVHTKGHEMGKIYSPQNGLGRPFYEWYVLGRADLTRPRGFQPNMAGKGGKNSIKGGLRDFQPGKPYRKAYRLPIGCLRAG